ncbi:tyrosine-type recombinase/integrase [Saccharopolyspora sp. K220]|uniref:tyrosine-type recombinase/integrase n=1 Tax=Saccharopolyspora soli TaxID=2926618 RepID=UPI001F595756|nr:tyrosine-type recombinase/integrase [Saccharopolyspora soli]MCI2422136.1 tyrosine-type recombinase/integrase [Saccharopolyspora soli]
METVFQAIKNARRRTGRVYEARYRRGLWARFHAVLELGRKTALLAELPSAFSRHSSQTIGREEANEDEIGRALPETVIAQLDQNLHLLGTDRTYGRAWSTAATQTMFRAAYEILRDTGRRPGEVVSLIVDCLEVLDGEYFLIYDNHKKKRHRRRLPITTPTAGVIQRWQDYRARLDLPASTQPWLFPAWGETAGPGHLSTNRLVRAFKGWAEAIPVLHSDLPGPDGTPLPFDRSLIIPYSLRHSYAQRHVDAGVAVEVLKELMDHRDLKVTQGYYTVSPERKRDAIKIMIRYVHDRTGTRTPAADSASAYEVKTVAVPFGNCIEPSNVKAGGQACPIRFQCAGCGFYRPDPSYPIYGHNNHNNVHTGQRVQPGQAIAEVGNRGETTGSHLHFQVEGGGQALDPASFYQQQGLALCQ